MFIHKKINFLSFLFIKEIIIKYKDTKNTILQQKKIKEKKCGYIYIL